MIYNNNTCETQIILAHECRIEKLIDVALKQGHALSRSEAVHKIKISFSHRDAIIGPLVTTICERDYNYALGLKNHSENMVNLHPTMI